MFTLTSSSSYINFFFFFFLEGGGDRSLCIPEAGTCLQQDFSPGTKIPVIVMFYLF